MIKKSLQAKLMLGVSGVILIVTAVIVILVARTSTVAINAKVAAEKHASLDAAERLLIVTDALMSERVKSSMMLLQAQAAFLGEAALGDLVEVNNRKVRNLMFGTNPQANQFELVDKVTAIMGGTATLFVSDGDDFVRVSTNVMKDGARAVGTVLDINGKAIKAIRKGESFSGQVDILGNPFITSYIPIKNLRNEIIGILYVGYKADLQALQDAVVSQTTNSTAMLLIDDHQRVRAFSKTIDESLSEKLIKGTTDQWLSETREFKPWGYQVLAASSQHEISRQVQRQALEIIGIGLITCALIILMLRIISQRIIIQPLQTAMALAAKIAEGKLNNPVHRTSEDEIDQLMSSLEHMQIALRRFVLDMGNASAQVEAAATALSGVADSTLTGVNDQRSRTDQVATAMTQMSASVTQVASNASEASAAAQAADVEVNHGRQVVREAVAAIQILAEEVHQVGVVVGAVAADTSQIGSVLDVIRSIADQTNLLALNAAIEAARAGEQGRGFAVVADEVRTLASRTQASTAEIQAMIQRLQQGSLDAESKVRSSHDKAQDSVTHAARVASSLEVIAKAVSRITDMNTQIVCAAEEQSNVADDVNRNVIKITEVADATHTHAQHTASATNQLHQLSIQLSTIAQRYK